MVRVQLWHCPVRRWTRDIDNSVIYQGANGASIVCETGTCRPFKCEKSAFFKTKNPDLVNYEDWLLNETKKDGCRYPAEEITPACRSKYGEYHQHYPDYEQYLKNFAEAAEYSATFDLPMNKRKKAIWPTGIRLDLKRGTYAVYDDETHTWPPFESHQLRLLSSLAGAALSVTGLALVVLLLINRIRKKKGISSENTTK